MLCQGVVCNDGNQCTSDGNCDPQSGQCPTPTPEAPGTACDAGGGPGSGTCDGAGNCTALQVCGDGSLSPGELCDDGNNDNGDGCDASCNWEPIDVQFNACCTITAPINLGATDVTVDTTALPLTTVLGGQTSQVSFDGTVDTSGIPVRIDATLEDPSNFTLLGVVGSSLMSTFDIPTPQAFNPSTNPIVDLGMHQMSIDIDPGAVQACIDVSDINVSIDIFGTLVQPPCVPTTCAGVPNTPVCIDVAQ